MDSKFGSKGSKTFMSWTKSRSSEAIAQDLKLAYKGSQMIHLLMHLHAKETTMCPP